jgi:hypothetical protein
VFGERLAEVSVSANPHPLQTALDRTTAATYTAIDLLDIADQRKPVNEDGKVGRPDARQLSLYGAIISSCIAAIEEAFEGLTLAGLASLGVPPAAMSSLAVVIGKSMQSPNPENLDRLMGDYLGFRPSNHWTAYLAHSPAVNVHYHLKDQSLDHRHMYTTFASSRPFARKELSGILARFAKIRNYFAHQDASVKVFKGDELQQLRALRNRPANSASEEAFLEVISATCAVTLDANASPTENPVVDWTLHETHPRNALFLCIGIVASTCDSLALHLESSGILISSYDRLTLCAQEGKWSEWTEGFTFGTSNVDFTLVPYRPSLRKRR